MGNVRKGNKIYIDSTGTVVSNGPVKVAYIFFTPGASGDQLVLQESSSGSPEISVKGATAHQSEIHDFSRRPIVFNDGIYVQTITSGATATLITTNKGAD